MVVILTQSSSDTNASIKANTYTHAKVAPYDYTKAKQEIVVQTGEFIDIYALHIKRTKLYKGSKQGSEAPVFFLPIFGSDSVHVVCLWGML